MKKKGVLFIIILVLCFNTYLFTQTHMAVPLGDPVYHVLEQAQLRGLCGFLPSVKPYSRAMVVSIINEIL